MAASNGTNGRNGSDAGRVLRVAQIGCGQIAPQHWKGYAASSLVDLAVLVDSDPVAAREASEANGGVEWITSFEDAIRRPDVDFISIATPHYLHAPMTVAAAEAGKHVLCEKPLTTTLDDADRMIEACERNGVLLGMWMVLRYSGAMRAARTLLQAGAIGRIVNIRLPDVHNKVRTYYERGVGGRARPSTWRAGVRTAGGGALIMNAIHQIDALRYVTGLEVERASAEWIRFTGLAEVEDMINVVLRYDNGAIGTIDTANYAAGGGEPHTLRIYGDRGQLQLARNSDLKIFLEQPFEGRDGLPSFGVGDWHDVPVEKTGESRQLLVDDFARAITTGQQPPITGRDGRAALATVLAAYAAADRGETVRIADLAARTPVPA